MRTDYDVVIDTLDLILMIFFLGVIVFCIVRMQQKAGVLTLCEKGLQVHSQVVPIEEIKEIRIAGYFKPVIGIKIKNKIMVPLSLSFVITDNQDQAMKEMKAWAVLHEIPVQHKNFTRWV